MLKRYIFLLMLVFTSLFALPATVSAVDPFSRDTCKRFEGQPDDKKPTVCKDKELNGANPFTGQGGILTTVINILTTVVAIVAIIVIILAGLKFITSGNNPQDVSNAREQIIYAAIALVIAAIAQVLVRFVVGRL